MIHRGELITIRGVGLVSGENWIENWMWRNFKFWVASDFNSKWMLWCTKIRKNANFQLIKSPSLGSHKKFLKFKFFKFASFCNPANPWIKLFQFAAISNRWNCIDECVNARRPYSPSETPSHYAHSVDRIENSNDDWSMNCYLLAVIISRYDSRISISLLFFFHDHDNCICVLVLE